MFILLAAAQTSAPVAPEPPNIYSSGAASGDRCAAQPTDGEIVVCGRNDRDQRYRVGPVAGPDFREKPPEARFKLSDKADMSLHGESGAFGIPRAMVTFKLRF